MPNDDRTGSANPDGASAKGGVDTGFICHNQQARRRKEEEVPYFTLYLLPSVG
jgi:hypothetical protein